MAPTYFCPRCGSKGLSAVAGRAACWQCGQAFSVPVVARATRATAYDIFTAVLLYLCMPVGLMMLWIHPTWPLRRKVLLTSVAVCVVVVPLILCLIVAAASSTILHRVASPP